MRKLLLALTCITVLPAISGSAQTLIQPANPVSTVQSASEPVDTDMPQPKPRRRLLCDFGLFGCGFRVGWLKPKSYADSSIKDRRIGKPIFNVSAGTHAFGIGKD